MTALDEFYEAYLHYSVSQRLFEDRCRQLTECDGTVNERQALVDETLRLAVCVTNNVIDLEPLLSEAAEELRDEGEDRDLLKALSLVSNSMREDRDRADSYTLFVTARRSGNTVRRPRRPRVANPFEFAEKDGEGEAASAPAPVGVPEEGPVGEDSAEDVTEEGEPAPVGPIPSRESAEEAHTEEDGTVGESEDEKPKDEVSEGVPVGENSAENATVDDNPEEGEPASVGKTVDEAGTEEDGSTEESVESETEIQEEVPEGPEDKGKPGRASLLCGPLTALTGRSFRKK